MLALVAANLSSAVAAIRIVPQIVTGQVGIPVSTQLTASGGVGPYAFNSASLGYGVSISSTGLVSGTPNALTPSPYVIVQLQVADLGNTAQPIQSVPIGLNFTTPPLAITSTTLPNGRNGAGFLTPVTLSATGGVPPYSWSLAAGSLYGLTLNADGSFSGSFATTGPITATFTAQVTDAQRAIRVQQYTFTIYDILRLTSPSSISSGIVGSLYTSPQPIATGGAGPYVWSATGLPIGFAINPQTGVFSGNSTSPVSSPVTLTATDLTTNQAASATFTLRIFAPLTIAPPVPFGPAVVGVPFTPVQVLVTGGSGKYVYGQTGLPPGLVLDPATGIVSGTPTGSTIFIPPSGGRVNRPAANAGPTGSGSTSQVVFTAQDSGSGQSASTGSTPLVVYSPLTISGPSPMNSAVAGSTYSGATFTASGGSGNYQWSLSSPSYGLTIDSLGQITGTVAGSPGRKSITVTVQDPASNQTASQTSAFQITGTAPTITGPASLPPAVTGLNYSGPFIQVSGGSGNFSWSQTGLPGGITIDPTTGRISGPSGGTAGVFQVTITLVDQAYSARVTQSYSFQVYSQLSLTGPSSLPNGILNQTYSGAQAQASGGSGNVVWSAIGLPPGLSIDTLGRINGTPSVAGSFYLSIAASDPSSNQTASRAFTVTIAPGVLTVGPAPTLATVPVGTGVSATLTATGGQAPYTWTPSGALPPGVQLSSTGLLTGTATVAGNYIFSATVSDSQSPAVTSQVNLSLGVLGLTTSPSLPAASTTSTYAVTLSASGGTGPYTFAATGLPSGLALGASGLLAGQPKSSGTYNFTVTVTDATGVKTSSNYTVFAAPSASLVIQSASPLSDGSVGNGYSLSLVASNGAAPYTWSVTGGTLPDGLSLTSGGNINGVPTKPGSFPFSVTALDVSGGTATANLTITVQPSQLRITNATLPSGIAGSDYPQQLLGATGGVGAVTYAITAGALPDGLTLVSGVISGIPIAPQSSTFTVTATDTANNVATANLAIGVRAAGADLILSSSNLSFAMSVGSAGLPDAQNVTVKSGAAGVNISYSVTVPASATWLSVTNGSGLTPSTIQFRVNSSAQTLTASPGPASVTITCLTGACANLSQAITVSLDLTNTAPKLTVLTDRLSFSSTTAITGASNQNIQLRNDGGGTIQLKSASCNASWCTPGATSGAIPSGSVLNVAVYADPSGLASGYYRTTVDFATTDGTSSVPVTLFVATAGSVVLAPSGRQFIQPVSGLPGTTQGSFLITVAGSGSINWSAAVQPGSPWLKLGSSTGVATSTTPSNVLYSIDTTVSSTLAAKAYYGTIRVTSPDGVNSPVDFQVILNVVSANTPSSPDPQPAGLLFLTGAGTSPPPQTITVNAGSSTNGTVAYQASATMLNGTGWLQVTPSSGTTSGSAAAVSTVSVTSTNLAPGVYYGGVSYALAAAGVRTVNITLIVQASAPASLSDTSSGNQIPQLRRPEAGGCTASSLAPTQTGLVNNFSAPTSWPTPLAIRLYNDCGAAVTNGQITVTFSNGDPPLAMGIADSKTALYSATWTPRSTSTQVTVTARSIAPGFAAASSQIIGTVTPNKAPILAHNGTLHIFSPQIGGALAPGNVVQIYGSSLGGQNAAATLVPLPSDIGGTSVIIGGLEAPLFFVGPNQIDAQVPFELTAGKQYQVVVNANGALTAPDTVNLTADVPGMAAFADGTIIAQHSDGSLVTATAPALPSEYLVIYSSGLGKTDNVVATGAGSPSSPLAKPVDTVSLTIDGASANVLFAGLTPGLVGLYQINFQVPASAKTGNLALIVTQNGVVGNPTFLPVGK